MVRACSCARARSPPPSELRASRHRTVRITSPQHMAGPMGRETWKPGLNLGRYVLLHELARGGMAEIWLAQQPGPQGFNREPAVKRIITTRDEPKDLAKTVFDEARLASQAGHP